MNAFVTNRFLLFSALIFVIGCTPPETEAPASSKEAESAAPTSSDSVPVSWKFETTRPQDDPNGPMTNVHLVVDGTTHAIRKDVNAGFGNIEPGQWDVPNDAVAACMGWWAGGGEVLYVMKEGKGYGVYHAIREEQVDSEPFERIQQIPAP